MRLLLALAVLCGAAFVVVGKVAPSRTPSAVSPRAPLLRMPARPPARRPSARKPPQLVVVSFDGSGGIRLWPYWRAGARRAHARFTFFVHVLHLLPDGEPRGRHAH